jgi:hypothetical protein
LYLLAFALVLAAGAVLLMSVLDFLASIRLLWVSIALSGGAIVAALAGVLLPKREG